MVEQIFGRVLGKGNQVELAADDRPAGRIQAGRPTAGQAQTGLVNAGVQALTVQLVKAGGGSPVDLGQGHPVLVTPELDVKKSVVQTHTANGGIRLPLKLGLDGGGMTRGQGEIVDHPRAGIGVGVGNRPQVGLAAVHPALDRHLGTVHKLFDQHHVLDGQGVFVEIDIAPEKRRVERRPGRVVPPRNVQRPVEVGRRLKLKAQNAEVQPRRLEVARVGRNRGVGVVQVNGLAANRLGLGATPVVFVQAQKDRLHARAGKAELLAQGGGDQVGHVPRVKNGVNMMATDIVPALIDIGQQIELGRGGAGVERGVEQVEVIA